MLGRLLEKLSGPSHTLRSLLLALVCVLTFAPGIASLPPTDRDESRFIQATKQMAETGDYLDIRFQTVPRYKKPIGIYWLQSAALKLTGADPQSSVWAYRLVSLAGGIIAVLGVAWLGSVMFGGAAGLIAGLLMAGAFMLCFEARIAKTDAFLLAVNVIAQAALASAYLSERTRRPDWSWAIFWAAIGIGILVKGPITPLLALTTIAALFVIDREAGWLWRLRPLPGIAIAALVAAPWLAAITWKSGGAFWAEAVGRDLVGKIAEGQESHGAWPGYYALIFPLFIWPLPVFAIQGMLAAMAKIKSDARLRFLLAWHVPFWLFVELLPTKLPHYVLPVYPALVLMAAYVMTADAVSLGRPPVWHSWLINLTKAGHAVATLALAGLAAGLVYYTERQISVAGIFAAIAVLATGAVGAQIGPVKTWHAVTKALALTAGSAIVWSTMAGLVLPAADSLWPSRQIAAVFKQSTRGCAEPQLISIGFQEPSLVFLAGTNTLTPTSAAGAKAMAENPRCALAAVTADEKAAFLAALGQAASDIESVRTLNVINYSKGRHLVIELFRLKPA